MKKAILTAICAGIVGTATCQQLSLIRDINPGSASSNICYLTPVNNLVFFVATNGVNGMELWKSDGTGEGTVMVKDINPGAANASIGYLTNVNGILFFVANDGVNGTELWKSDGTEAGTVMVKDIRPGSMGSNPASLAAMDGLVYFAANDGFRGTELWKSDGTAAGTVLVSDIYAGSSSSSPTSLAAMDNVLYFAADNGANGAELWKSDGTSAGTVLVKDIWSGSTGSLPTGLVNVSGTLFFAAATGSNGSELWKSDGTAAGTTLVKDIWPGTSAANPFSLRNINGTLFFSANNGANGIELWKSDGTPAGTVMVRDVWSGSQSGTIGNFARYINDLVFTGNDGINGNKTWQSNGTASGTAIATGMIDPGSGTLQELVDNFSSVFATVTHSETGRELWGVGYASTLPLTWLEFRGQLSHGDVLLDWKTMQEINTRDFFVERSADGINFGVVGNVTAANSSGEHRYSFTDPEVVFPGSGKMFYRLRQVNRDGKTSYSAIVTIRSGANSIQVSLFPNPANDQVSLSITGSGNSSIQWELVDVAGRMLKRARHTLSPGANVFPVDVQQLPAGLYFINVHGTVVNEKLRLVKR